MQNRDSPFDRAVKRPVWSFEEVRDTNAPVSVVTAFLKDPASLPRWQPRLRGASLHVLEEGLARFVAAYAWRPTWGVAEEGRLEVIEAGGRTLLTHRARFRGWPVLLLMGWWRLRSHHMWERLVRSL